MASILFSTIEVSAQVFYRAPLAAALVNLKPLVPGHVLVIPRRPAPRVADLSAAELGALLRAVQRVGAAVERAYGARALTIACQDGPAAGQSVPHVHFHVLPRGAPGDAFAGARNDAIYPALEAAEAALAPPPGPLKMDNEERTPRSAEEMAAEARWLATFFDGEGGEQDEH